MVKKDNIVLSMNSMKFFCWFKRMFLVPKETLKKKVIDDHVGRWEIYTVIGED